MRGGNRVEMLRTSPSVSEGGGPVRQAGSDQGQDTEEVSGWGAELPRRGFGGRVPQTAGLMSGQSGTGQVDGRKAAAELCQEKRCQGKRRQGGMRLLPPAVTLSSVVSGQGFVGTAGLWEASDVLRHFHWLVSLRDTSPDRMTFGYLWSFPCPDQKQLQSRACMKRGHGSSSCLLVGM